MVHIAQDSGGKLKTDITDHSLKEKHLTEVSMTRILEYTCNKISKKNLCHVKELYIFILEHY